MVALNIILLPLWFLAESQDITVLEFLVNLIICFSLLIWNYRYAQQSQKYNYILPILLMIFSMIIAGLLHYFNWGIWSGNLLTPDHMTVFIMKAESIILSIIVITIGVLQQFLLYRHKKSIT
jgi:hypothetical protein